MRNERAKALERIKHNIERSGFHIYLVSGGPTPRFAYTIGLRESLGAELVLAGALYYGPSKQVSTILHAVRDHLDASKTGAVPAWDAPVTVDDLGSFRLGKAHSSWTRPLLLGARDYHKADNVDAYQVIPDDAHTTIDVPDMTSEWTAASSPAWRWKHEPWPYAVDRGSDVFTNLAALRGARINEVKRDKETSWEMLAGVGAKVTIDECRFAPLGTLLAHDHSLAAALELKVGYGLWRDDEDNEWTEWGYVADDDSN